MRVVVLLGVLILVSALVIIFEWQAIRGISWADDHGGSGVDAVQAAVERAENLAVEDAADTVESASRQRRSELDVQAASAQTATMAPHEVSCGQHVAASCSECPMGNGEPWCNGECVWQDEACIPKSKASRAATGKFLGKGVQNVVAFPAFPTPADPRHRDCRGKTWDTSSLPTITMVIPYLNEQWYQISATVASIIGHTPPELLDEILFIDDGNPPEFMFHEQLQGLHAKVKVHRNAKREGLIKSKVIGAAMVRSEVIMFMEPHCIVAQQWLQPLLAHMAKNPDHSTLGMPTLDIIPEDNFNRYTGAGLQIGGFDWSLTFNWMVGIAERDKTYKAPSPYATPALSGGIFAIYRDYWFRSGTYDDQMTEWGGEHIEMSLRTWRCGGRIEIVPCSRIGHVFRAANPYVVHQTAVVRNLKRAALVWLDERLEDFYREMPHARRLDAGDVSERLALKEQMQCKSMTWYVDNVYPELNTKQARKR